MSESKNSQIDKTPTVRRLYDELAVLSLKVQDPAYSAAAHERYVSKLCAEVDFLLDILTEDDRYAKLLESVLRDDMEGVR